VLSGKTLTTVGYRRATDMRATTRTLHSVGAADFMARPGQQCRGRGAKSAEYCAPQFFYFSFSFTFLKIHINF
jgi:hypothetical protein